MLLDIIIFLKNKVLKLPAPMRVVAQKIWRGWCGHVVWDYKMVDFIADYFKISKKETKFLLRSGGRLDAFFWHYLNSQGLQESFYKTTPFYIYDLAFWHMTKYQRMFRSKIMELAHGKILDYGGGIGDLSLALRQKGFSVTYGDVDGQTFNFAKSLFLKNNISVRMVNLLKENIGDNYDTIICIDVIEHIENQKEVLALLVSRLNINGILIITNLEFNAMDQDQHQNHPMHIPIIFDAKKYLLDNGLKATEYPWAFVRTQ